MCEKFYGLALSWVSIMSEKIMGLALHLCKLMILEH